MHFAASQSHENGGCHHESGHFFHSFSGAGLILNAPSIWFHPYDTATSAFVSTNLMSQCPAIFI
jgi:hypothetical protein